MGDKCHLFCLKISTKCIILLKLISFINSPDIFKSILLLVLFNFYHVFSYHLYLFSL